MGNRLSHVRELFDKLDHGQKGYLDLEDLIHGESTIPVICHSPIIFFKVCLALPFPRRAM